MKPNSDSLQEDFNSNDLAYNTYIATPEGQARIQEIQPGDSVLAFSATLESGKIKLTSYSKKVSFSDGSGYGKESPMILILLEESLDSEKELLCSFDQLFLLPNGTYIQAKDLQIGQNLVDKDGNPVQIVQLINGKFKNGLHAIATDAGIHTKYGHLLLANGIIIGDFILQMNFNDLDN